MTEFDPEVPFNPILVLLLAQSHFRDSHTEPELKPSREQFALGPGDTCLMAATHSDVDDDFTVVKLLDPEEHAQQFPDWQYRVEISGYVLGEWHSQKDPEGNIGWFKRVKLVPIDKEQYEQVVGWVAADELPEDPPDWIGEAYARYAEQISRADPGKIPTPSKCSKCGEIKVVIRAMHTTKLQVIAGDLEVEGVQCHVSMSEPERQCDTKVWLHCQGCHDTREVDPHTIRIDWSVFH